MSFIKFRWMCYESWRSRLNFMLDADIHPFTRYFAILHTDFLSVFFCMIILFYLSLVGEVLALLIPYQAKQA